MTGFLLAVLLWTLTAAAVGVMTGGLLARATRPTETEALFDFLEADLVGAPLEPSVLQSAPPTAG